MTDRDDLDMSLIERLRKTVFLPLRLILRGLWAMVPRIVKDHWLVHTTIETVRLVRANRAMGIAAEISFWGVLSITPLLLVSASALGFIDGIVGLEVADDVRAELTSFVVDLLGIGDQGVEAIDDLFDGPNATGLTIGLITSVYASSRGFTSLIGGLDHITGRDQRHSWLMTRVYGLITAVLAVPALVALLVLVTVGRTGFGLPHPWSDIVAALLWPVITLCLLGFALALLHGSPAERTPLRFDLLGALVTVVIWLGGSWIAVRSLASFGADVLGILGGSVGLLFWLYLMTAGMLIGAQVSVAWLNITVSRSISPIAVPDLADSDEVGEFADVSDSSPAEERR